MTSLSYAFTPFTIKKKTILRPMLPVTIKYSSTEFPTMLLVDSGADYSILRREVVEDGLNIDISTLKKAGETSGITGKTKVAIIDAIITFGTLKLQCKEKIQFQVSLEPDKDPPLSLLGRNPFFYSYRIDFRMGYTTDPALGKFVLYPEKHKRNAKMFGRPMKIKKK